MVGTTVETNTSSESASPTDPGADGTTEETEGTDPTDGPDPGTGTGVRKQRYCSDIDPGSVAEVLDLEEAEILVDREPEAGAPQVWTCTIGQPTGGLTGVTGTLHDGRARKADLAETLKDERAAFGSENCEAADDEAMGAGTRGIDCRREGSGTDSSTIGFAAVSRARIVDDTLLECLIASASADDLAELVAAPPEACALFLEVVVE